MELKRKTISGVFWSLGQQFSIKIVGFTITILLARILTPAEFGLIAMLSVFISVGNVLMDSGLTSSLIRTKGADQQDYATVFYVNLAGSVLIYFLLFCTAPFVARFYRQEVLSPVLRVYGLIIILNAFFAVQNTILTKEMNFRRQTNIQIPSAIAGGILGIVLAKLGYGVWSLVWMSLFTAFCSTLMHWMASPWRPSRSLNLEKLKYHFGFGYKIALSSILDSIHQNIYVLIIGKFYSVTALGYYSRAEAISQLPVSNISHAISKVTYPMFSEIAEDNAQLKTVYRKIMQQVIFWNAPALIFLSIIAEPLFRLMLTEKWLPAVPYFQILCIAGIMYPLHAYNLNILKVKGRSDLLLRLEVIKKTVSVIGILSVFSFGIYGLLYFQLLFNFFGYYINSGYSGKLINYPTMEQVADLLPILAMAAVTGLCSYFLDVCLTGLLQLKDWSRMLISGLFYALLYLFMSNLFRLTAITDFKQLIKKNDPGNQTISSKSRRL